MSSSKIQIIMSDYLALVLSYFSGNWWWFGVSLLIHLNVPYTLKFMMLTNNRLMADDVDPNSEQTITDLKNWGGLHLVRTVWNGGIFIAFLGLTLLG